MSSIFGKNIKVIVFGQSHSKAIGVTIDGLPTGFKIDFDELQNFLNRRAPGNAKFATARKEPDKPEFLSGVVDNVTCGSPLTAVIYNQNAHSNDYNNIIDIPRPGHADFTAQMKYKGAQDVAGGGHFSGRLTAPLCIAGGIIKQILSEKGIEIFAHISSIKDAYDDTFDKTNPDIEQLKVVSSKKFAVLNEQKGEQMLKIIEEAKQNKDSVGGTIECVVTGLEVGVGNPMFDGLENVISSAVFGVPAVKGIEFGNGFDSTCLFGSQNNDEFYYDNDEIKTKTNNHGGILGGISSGMPLYFKVAIKPTPSIAKQQNSVSFAKKDNVKLEIKGRHDPCIVPRAVPVIEAVTAIAIYDALLED